MNLVPLIVDIEATCWGKAGFSENGFSETIEIGAVVLIDKRIEEFSIFIKPVIFPKLSDFCTNLTSITQKDVDNAVEFKEAWERFNTWYEDSLRYLFISWGDYDKLQLNKELWKKTKTRFPFPYHLNLKQLFLTKTGKKRGGVMAALKYFDLEFEGTPHRGIDDAKNIAKLYTELIK